MREGGAGRGQCCARRLCPFRGEGRFECLSHARVVRTTTQSQKRTRTRTRTFVGTQEPGDIIYVPEGFGHAVLNLEDTLAVATEIRLNK